MRTSLPIVTMRNRIITATVELLLATAATAASGWPWGLQNPNSIHTDFLAYTGLGNLVTYTIENGFPTPGACTLENLAIRSEW